MERLFNTASPTIAADHYHLNPLHRPYWDEIQQLSATKRYVVLHAPRQTGILDRDPAPPWDAKSWRHQESLDEMPIGT